MYRIAAQSVELHQHTISPDFEEEAWKGPQIWTTSYYKFLTPKVYNL